jgi:hypothetical protein
MFVWLRAERLACAISFGAVSPSEARASEMALVNA